MSAILRRAVDPERESDCLAHDAEMRRSLRTVTRASIPSCSCEGNCDPNRGRGQGRDCAASFVATQNVWAGLLDDLRSLPVSVGVAFVSSAWIAYQLLECWK